MMLDFNELAEVTLDLKKFHIRVRLRLTDKLLNVFLCSIFFLISHCLQLNSSGKPVKHSSSIETVRTFNQVGWHSECTFRSEFRVP